MTWRQHKQAPHLNQAHKNKKAFSLRFQDTKIAMKTSAILDKLCTHCYETIDWKLQYGKYNPITTPGTCNRCCKKLIIKSYRTICDYCAIAEEPHLCTKCTAPCTKYHD
jgi:hypothetical protein